MVICSDSAKVAAGQHDIYRIMKTAFQFLLFVGATLTFGLIVIFAIGAFVFTAATSASDPNEHYEPVMMLAVATVAIACAVYGWILAFRWIKRPSDGS